MSVASLAAIGTDPWTHSGSDVMDPILDRLRAVKRTGTDKYTARCPAHDDRTPSLSLKAGDDRRALVKCFAGCTPEDVMAANRDDDGGPVPRRATARTRGGAECGE